MKGLLIFAFYFLKYVKLSINMCRSAFCVYVVLIVS